MEERIFAGLNDEQADAVCAVRGAVCILAGAGSGKTTTITRRIAYQVATEAFAPGEILAVTFTEKAAREMAGRLSALGVSGVRAKTFHAEALAQYRSLSDDRSEILSSKGQILASIVARLRPPYRFTALRDVATEIEWAKNRRVEPASYRAAAGDRQTAIPPDLMAGVYASYERAKARAGLMDFEDLLTRTVELLRSDERALSRVRARYFAFTVDEYQDVNPLQQNLLDAWAGDERDDVCVVGDDYQSIFGFTGATPRYLLSFPERYPNALIVRLTLNYRSTPEVLGLANRLVPGLGGSEKTLRPALPSGPEPLARELLSADGETGWIVAQARTLHDEGVPWEEIAVLYRINGRSEDLEEALTAARIPYQVRDGAFLRRPAARGLLARLRRADTDDVAEEVEGIAHALGLRHQEPEEGVAEEEATRQADLKRLVALAREYPGEGGVAGFIADLGRRFAAEEDQSGVQILTYHRAKGLEFDAVFLPRLEDKELPFVLAKAEEDVAEERRLLYVGITRAKRRLFLSWARSREGERRKSPRPSPFLAEIRATPAPAAAAAAAERLRGNGNGHAPAAVAGEHAGLFKALKEWRLERARTDGVPAYVVFHDETLAQIATRRPSSRGELLTVPGIGPTKLTRYGEDVLAVVERAG